MTAATASIQYTADEIEFQKRRTVKCRDCQAPIIWFTTLRGKKMPVNADTVFPFDHELDLRTMRSHFADCPAAAKHRKPR